MEKLEVTYRIVTPLFLGGARPNKFAELRPPSIKGVMRYWYRALDKDYRKNEQEIFGGTEKKHGQSRFLLTIDRQLSGNMTYPSSNISYFAYPFNMGGNSRKYIREAGTEILDQQFTVHLVFRKSPNAEIRKAILASLWLLGHIGGLGARSRRGFGSVALVNWKNNHKPDWPEIAQLTSAHQAESPKQWIAQFKNALQVLKTWFPEQPNPNHMTFGKQTIFYLINNQQWDTWDKALASAADIMQNFRNRKTPDYRNVKAHICNNQPLAAAVAPDIAPAPLNNAPERTAFGLPLTFRYNSLKYEKSSNGKIKAVTPSTTFQGTSKGVTRGGSRIFIRIIKAGSHYYPLFCRFDGNLISPGNTIKDTIDGTKKFVPPQDHILNEFMDKLPQGEKVSW